MPDIKERVIEAFGSAYPEVPAGKLEHMARNFTQIIRGIINIGETVGGEGEVSHIEMVNGLVYSCVAITFLYGADKGGTDEAIESRMGECVAKVADWLLGLEILRDEPELYASFVRGAVALGAADWETERGKITY
ncbi:MAG: hypothetical protein MUO75_06620 [Actinobacteria bacterium]|nr:hypothetical protein [Actinomycetota bacterium]